MDLSGQASQARFASYVEALVEVIGHADRAEPLNDYCVGLLMPGERKSVEPMAAIVAPARVSAKHQSLLHLVGQAPWSDEAVLQKIRELVLPGIERQGRIEAWIVDDTGFTKKGTHSVGVARQYCGRLGKQDNCQVAVTLSIANHSASLPIAYRLYLPETWANDAARRKKTHVPKDIRFKTKPQIALDQIRAAHAEGVAPGIVLADAGYGANSDFRAGVSALNLPYVVGIQSTPSVWPPGQAPLPPKPWSGRGRRPCNVQRDDEHKPVSVKDLALSLGKKAWRSVTWREGSNAPLASRFATVRVHLAARDYKRTTPHPVEWLLVEWPKGEAAPTKHPALDLLAQAACPAHAGTWSTTRHADDVGQAALHLGVADEDAAGPTDRTVHQARLLQRGEHLAQARAAGGVAHGELALATQLRAGNARVDVGDDAPPQLLSRLAHGNPYCSPIASWDSGRIWPPSTTRD